MIIVENTQDNDCFVIADVDDDGIVGEQVFVLAEEVIPLVRDLLEKLSHLTTFAADRASHGV